MEEIRVAIAVVMVVPVLVQKVVPAVVAVVVPAVVTVAAKGAAATVVLLTVIFSVHVGKNNCIAGVAVEHLLIQLRHLQTYTDQYHD